jgi:hypothetical protein
MDSALLTNHMATSAVNAISVCTCRKTQQQRQQQSGYHMRYTACMSRAIRHLQTSRLL